MGRSRENDGSAYRLDDLEVRSEGRGEPTVVLLHGWGGDVNSLNAIGKPLSDHRRVVAISLPGFGGSPEPAHSWGTWQYVDLVVRWLADNTSGRIDLIAHSFGGRVAVGLAARHPELIERLVLVAGAGLKPPRSLKTRVKLAAARVMTTLANLLGGTIADRLSARKQTLGSADWQNASPLMRGTLSRVLREDLSAECRSIAQPTLLLWGENDNETPLILGTRMSKLIKDSQLHTIRGAGHYLFLDKPGDVISAVWKHLNAPSAW